MKCLIISGIYPPDIGGPATFAENLIYELNSRGYNVTLLSLCEQKSHIIRRQNFTLIRFSRKYPKFLRFIFITFLTRILIFGKDLVLATGMHEEVGLALLGSKTLSIAKIVGNPIWERSMNRQKQRYQSKILVNNVILESDYQYKNSYSNSQSISLNLFIHLENILPS